MINIFCLAYLSLTTPSQLVLAVLELTKSLQILNLHSCSLYLVVFGDELCEQLKILNKILAKLENMG